MSFQAEGTPLAVDLIAIDNSFLKTVRIPFSALDTSNQGRDIKETLFLTSGPILEDDAVAISSSPSSFLVLFKLF